MLTGNKIIEEQKNGNIEISDFSLSRVNPNSYNVRLSDKIYVYELKEGILDSKKCNGIRQLTFSKDGLVLQPNTLYIASTIEKTKTDKYVACLDGRSSIARLGIQIHMTAGFGDLGFDGNWTIEMTCVHPVRIYPEMEIGQIYFEEVFGDIGILYNGKYQGSESPIESRMYMDFQKNNKTI